jgi:hypothetical protein
VDSNLIPNLLATDCGESSQSEVLPKILAPIDLFNVLLSTWQKMFEVRNNIEKINKNVFIVL